MVNFVIVVGVAQLVERRSVAPNVAGSIPVSHPNPILNNSFSIAIEIKAYFESGVISLFLGLGGVVAAKSIS
jgi:hypothetical protein